MSSKIFFFLFIPFSRPDSECLYLSFFPFGPLLHLTNGFFAPTNSRCTFLPLFFLSFLPSPSQQLPAPSIGFKHYCRDLPSRSSRVFERDRVPLVAPSSFFTLVTLLNSLLLYTMSATLFTVANSLSSPPSPPSSPYFNSFKQWPTFPLQIPAPKDVQRIVTLNPTCMTR